jgi:hypothetical protein
MILLDAVDDLTKPTRVIVQQDDQNKTVRFEALLDQLEAAIHGTIGIGSSGALANERNVLDADALHQFSTIRTTVQSWARMVGIEYKRDATTSDLLRAWYVQYMTTKPEEKRQAFYLKELRKWAAMIRTKLDPPRQRDLPNACPLCGSDIFWKDGDQYKRPLIVTFRDGADMIMKAKALCRACDQVWSARELAYALEQADNAQNAG